MEHIDSTFCRLQEEAENEFRKVYNNIGVQLKNSDSSELGGEIAQLEAKTLNSLVVTLMESAKKAAIAEMKFNGCAPYLTQTGWTEIQQVVGVPLIELCKVKVNMVSGSRMESGTASENDEQKLRSKIAQCEAGMQKGRTATAVGGGMAAIAVVTLIIPGWDVPVSLALGLGLAGGAAAAYGVKKTGEYTAQRDDAVSKLKAASTDQQARKQVSEEVDSVLAKVMDSQCERNAKLYIDWLGKVKDALVAECEKLADM